MTTPPMAPSKAPAKPRAKAESDVAHAAYLVYEGMGAERSYPALVSRLKAADPAHYRSTDATLLRRVKQWNHDHGWRERVRDYDTGIERARREKAEAALARMNDDQARLAASSQLKLLTSLNDLLDIDQAVINSIKQAQQLIAQRLPVPPELEEYVGLLRPRLLVSAATRAEMWRNMIDVERLARGAATEIAQQQYAGGIRVHVVTSTTAGQETASPFGFDPNMLLRMDADGATGGEEDEEDVDTVEADVPPQGTPPATPSTSPGTPTA